MRVLCYAFAFALAACGGSSSPSSPPPSPALALDASAAPTAPPPPDFDGVVARIAAGRADLAAQYAAATTDDARAKLRASARTFLQREIEEDLFPLWLGTPWGMGADSTATRPHEPNRTVSCSSFVTAILGNAGFHVADEVAFRRAQALDIQRSLARSPHAVHRFLSIPAADLERRVGKLGDGLWLIGLSNHIAWVVVADGKVRLVQSSWSDAHVVTDEPLVSARTIDLSRKSGYFVTPVVVASDENDDLIDAWLRGTDVHFRS